MRHRDVLHGRGELKRATPVGLVTHTLAERWNGAKWSIVPSPNPHVNTIVFDGVSCTSTSNCSAVGYYDVPKLGTSDTLVEHWDGKTWKIVASPNAAGGASSLVGVSCPSPFSCIAVGGIFEGAGPSGLPPSTGTARRGR